ncbi:unnamed protein product [Prorocentrum cordatum]|uniref:Uncharacterized protein n=1 Tax=Prorocentrum cordatum TaxID=2364126 RepID=A0ABN9X772_9DINO|nr:unnamed protein product [Polarella glacialis]
MCGALATGLQSARGRFAETRHEKSDAAVTIYSDAVAFLFQPFGAPRPCPRPATLLRLGLARYTTTSARVGPEQTEARIGSRRPADASAARRDLQPDAPRRRRRMADAPATRRDPPAGSVSAQPGRPEASTCSPRCRCRRAERAPAPVCAGGGPLSLQLSGRRGHAGWRCLPVGPLVDTLAATGRWRGHGEDLRFNL